MSSRRRSGAGLDRVALVLALAGALGPALFWGAAPAAGSMGPGFRTAAATDTTGVVLTGQVRMQGWRAGAGLPAAIIELRQGDAFHPVVSDERGHYRVAGLERGAAVLQVRHMAAQPHEMHLLLPRDGRMVVDVALERRTIVLPPVGVRARRRAGRIDARPSASLAPTGAANPQVRLAAIESTSGLVESGLARVGRPLAPGEEDRPPDQALFMRGSTVDSRMVLLDGAPVLTPFHLAGLVPSFDARSLGAAAVHLGGAPARFEGGLSYVLDAHTRPAEQDAPRVEAAVDGLAVRGALNLRAGERVGLVATGRAFHGAQAAFTASSSLPYHFRDLLVRGDVDLGRAGALRATGFGNREGVVLGGADPAPFHDGEVDWGNRAFSLGWEADVGDNRLWALAAFARYDASLPVAWDTPVLAETRTDRHRAELRVARPWGDGVLNLGASFERQAPRYRLSLPDDVQGAPIAGHRLATGTRRIRGDRAGIFAEVELPFLARADVRLGGRVDHFDQETGVRISPRASFRVAVADDAEFTVSAGRYHQYRAEPGLLEDRSAQSVSTLRWDSGMSVASATHLVMELDQAFSPTLSLGVSGFVKRFREEGPGGLQRVSASGTDLRLTRQGERLDGWVGYALSWFWEPGAGIADPAPEDGAQADRRFSGRHLLTTGLRYRDSSGLRVGASLEFGAGLPLTEVPLALSDVEGIGPGTRNLTGFASVDRLARGSADNPLDLIREDDFLRLDLEASWVTHPVLGGRRTELRPYVRLLNALDRRDALFHYFDRWRDEGIRPLAERPVLPLIGVEWRF